MQSALQLPNSSPCLQSMRLLLDLKEIVGEPVPTYLPDVLVAREVAQILMCCLI